MDQKFRLVREKLEEVRSMIRIQSNDSVRNVAKNSLTGLKLLKDSVFFGINGSGKTTVTEVLSQSASLARDGDGHGEQIRVLAFDDNWRRSRVGKFVEGGSVEGVTTVKLSADAGGLEKKIRTAEEELKSAKLRLELKKSAAKTAEQTEAKVVDGVFTGERKLLEKRCRSLSGTKFKRPAIRCFLEAGNNEILNQSEIENQLRIANSKDPGILISLPELPRGWSFSDSLRDKITSDDNNKELVDINVSDWVREGLRIHQSGDSCQFCTGKVEEDRIKILEAAIEKIEKLASSLVLSELENCRRARASLQKFGDALSSCDLSTSIYSGNLEVLKDEALKELLPVIGGLKRSEKLLESIVRNPQAVSPNEIPAVDTNNVDSVFATLKQAHAEAIDKISRHSQNQDQAIERLKEHCCAKDGGGWNTATEAFQSATRELQLASKAESDAKRQLRELKLQVSTTADTASFLDSKLALILGEGTLRVEEGNVGEGYRITRYDQKAEGMSEGEKKLVSLLYFCAEFLAEDRQQSLANTVVIFDDLGSELDEPRLLMVDRFISSHFQKLKPASLVYFTHSHTYLKILQSRLGSRAFASGSGAKASEASSIFYEVYKDSFATGQQTTKCRQWDNEAVLLINDYWLSFYMVLRAFEDLQSGEVPALGTGNFCRKVLEGFTEFRAPNIEKFGARIDHILNKKQLELSPALSKLVNGLSHSDLTRRGGVLSRNEVEQATIQTLNLMRQVDAEHLEALLIKFRGKKGKRDIEYTLEQRTGNITK